MIYLETDSQRKVVSTYFMPFDENYGLGKTESELEITGFLVEEIPTPESIEGKYSNVFYTKEKGFWFEYVDIPKTPEQIQAEKIANIENQTAEYMVDLDFRLSNIELGL